MHILYALRWTEKSAPMWTASNGFIAPAKGGQGFSKTEVQAVYRNLLEGMDPKEGGTMGAPKFPLPVLYPFLLQYHELEREPGALELCSGDGMFYSALDPGTFQAMLEQAREKLWEAREKRVRPALDNKVIVSWNALMIKSLSDAYAAFHDPVFLERAMHAARFILSYARDDQGRLYRKLDGREPSTDAFPEDYALLCLSLIRLYEVSMQQEFILAARDLAVYAEKHFSPPGTNLFSFSSDESESLAAPSFEILDYFIPASNSVMAHNLQQLGGKTG